MKHKRSGAGHAEDVAFAITLAVVNNRAAGRIYNVAEVQALSGEEWVRHIALAAGWNGKIVVVPKGLLPIESDLFQHWVVDTTGIRQELGYTETVPQAAAFRRTIAWQRAHPPEEIDPAEFDYSAEDAILAEMGWGSR
ncbi:MAG: NAD-dependent epimerase/dehydratase [Anaerolineales bacterium]|nr:NAD-dependent epimerase/dehydratase [Anaerolineales bacterium]